jgi:hypothetical protein
MEFNLHIGEDGWPPDRIQIMILCDIRRELKKLNSLLHCHNFIEIPKILRGVRKNTYKRRRKKKP